MLVFKNMFSYHEPLNIIFLCGSHYQRDEAQEKRNVLKEFLEKPNNDGKILNRAIILEENFTFGRTNKKYLSYDDVFLTGLAQVEQLTSLYADKIIIIHETISTAAELGMFAINQSLAKKICLLTPDDISIEESKLSAFIKLAFINKNARENMIGNHIVYYPDVEVKKFSVNKSDYNTFFHNDEIGENLGKKILAFVVPDSKQKRIIIKKSNYKHKTFENDFLDYYVDGKNIVAFVHVDVLKIQLLALFFVGEFRRELRIEKRLVDHVTYIQKKYEEILLNTIADIEGLNEDCKIKIYLKDTTCKIRQAVGYFLYILQAARLIRLEQGMQAQSENFRKIRISKEIDICKNEIGKFIYKRGKSEFERQQI